MNNIWHLCAYPQPVLRLTSQGSNVWIVAMPATLLQRRTQLYHEDGSDAVEAVTTLHHQDCDLSQSQLQRNTRQWRTKHDFTRYYKKANKTNDKSKLEKAPVSDSLPIPNATDPWLVTKLEKAPMSDSLSTPNATDPWHVTGPGGMRRALTIIKTITASRTKTLANFARY